jgi:Flp pilus assembly pilin Flp
VPAFVPVPPCVFSGVPVKVVYQMVAFLSEFFRNESGQSLAEYAVIIGLVSIAAISALTFLGHKTNNSLQNSANQYP